MAGGGQLLNQLIGVAAIGAFSFVFAYALLFLLKKTIGIRVDEKEELAGLDPSEHEMMSYADFMIK